MKVQEIVTKAMSGEISWLAAADILGMSPRSVRRWKFRARHVGRATPEHRRHAEHGPPLEGTREGGERRRRARSATAPSGARRKRQEPARCGAGGACARETPRRARSRGDGDCDQPRWSRCRANRARCAGREAARVTWRRRRLNVHFHTMALDGVYVREPSGALAFHALGAPTFDEVQQVAQWTHSRIERVLRAHGRTLDGVGDEPAELTHDQPVLASCYAAAFARSLGAANCTLVQGSARVGVAKDTQSAGKRRTAHVGPLVAPIRTMARSERPSLCRVGPENRHPRTQGDLGRGALTRRTASV